MAKAKAKRRVTREIERVPQNITFVLTAKQRAVLKKIGMRDRQDVLLRAKFVRGKLLVTHHTVGGNFVPSNAAFA